MSEKVVDLNLYRRRKELKERYQDVGSPLTVEEILKRRNILIEDPKEREQRIKSSMNKLSSSITRINKLLEELKSKDAGNAYHKHHND